MPTFVDCAVFLRPADARSQQKGSAFPFAGDAEPFLVFSGALAHQTDELTDGLLALGIVFVGRDKIPQLRLVAE